MKKSLFIKNVKGQSVYPLSTGVRGGKNATPMSEEAAILYVRYKY